METNDKISNEELCIANFLRKNLPMEDDTLLRQKVDHFEASKAVECLMASFWGKFFFLTRDSSIRYLNKLLRHNFFLRAIKLEKCDSEDDQQKIVFVKHPEQIFVDGDELYVWVQPVQSSIRTIFVECNFSGIIRFMMFEVLLYQIFRSPKPLHFLEMMVLRYYLCLATLGLIRLAVIWGVWTVTLGKCHLRLPSQMTEYCSLAKFCLKNAWERLATLHSATKYHNTDMKEPESECKNTECVTDKVPQEFDEEGFVHI